MSVLSAAAASSSVDRQRLLGMLLFIAVVAAGMPRASWGAQLVEGQDYHSVQLLSGTSAAVLQESLALVADQPYARIDKRGAGYALRVGYWASREEAMQAARALLPKFRGAHARIATYRPDAIVASAGEQLTRNAAALPATPEVSPPSAASPVERPPTATVPSPSTSEVQPPGAAGIATPPSRASAPASSIPEAAPQRTEPAQTQGRATRRGAQLVTGQDYYSVQLTSAKSAAELQKSLALVADQPNARIEKRGAEYVLRVGYWDSRDEAAQAAKALLPKFRGAHTRIAPYQPDAMVTSAGEPRPTGSAPAAATGAQTSRPAAPEIPVQAGAQSQREEAALERRAAEERARRETLVRQQAEAQAEAAARERAAAEREATAQTALREKAEAEALRQAESRREAESRAAAAALARSAADERAAQEAAAKAQAEREADRVAREKAAEQQRLIEQAQARERAETEALRLAESRREAERRAAPEVSPLRTEPVQGQAAAPVMKPGSQLVVGQDYHSVQLLSASSAAVLEKSLPLVADQPYARIDKRGAAYILRVGYWDTRADAMRVAKALSRKFRGAHARIATYRPDAIVVWNGAQAFTDSPPVLSTPEVPPPGVAGTAEPPSRTSEQRPSTPELPPSVASAAEQPPNAFVPVPSAPAMSPPKAEPAQSQAPAVSREAPQNKPDPARQAEYQLGAGDTIKVVVFQNPDLTVEARVTENGTISFPLIGEVKLGGLSISAAEQTIAKALKDGGFIQQPQVNIILGQIRGYQVAVLGQVNRPGRFPLETTNIRVSEMIAIAGGIAPATGADVAVLTGTRDGKPFRKEIDITSLFVDNKLQDDLVVAGGDVIFVQRAPMYYIYGEVQRPGSYRVERNMTVRQALAQGGGPTIRGTERWLRLHRRGTDGKIEILKPGFDDLMLPEDVLYVRESIF